jgi:hypothetical protein
MARTVGSNYHAWKGGRHIFKSRNKAYINVLNPKHPRNNGRYVFEHILIAEKALGKYLPDSAVIHHINENGIDNRNANLVICQDNTYHKLLHKRIRALKACGNANWLRCRHCHKYDTPANLFVSKNTPDIYHTKCNNKYYRTLRQRRKAHGK